MVTRPRRRCVGATPIRQLRDILMPFAVGALIAYLGDPLVDRLEARGFTRTSGVALVLRC